MTKRPDGEALETAIAWLQRNPGEDWEAKDCAEVATWLRHLLIMDEEKRIVREWARARGVSVAAARQHLVTHGLVEAFARVR